MLVVKAVLRKVEFPVGLGGVCCFWPNMLSLLVLIEIMIRLWQLHIPIPTVIFQDQVISTKISLYQQTEEPERNIRTPAGGRKLFAFAVCIKPHT